MQGTTNTARASTPDLLGVLRERRAQVDAASAPYLAPVASHDSMLHWLAQTCRGARLAAGRKQVHVAAGANVDQSTVNRFENATAWPRNSDRLVAAYADDLDVEPIELWQQALLLWASDQARTAVGITQDQGPAASDGFQVPTVPRELRAALNPPREAQQPDEDTPRKRGSSGQGA